MYMHLFPTLSSISLLCIHVYLYLLIVLFYIPIRYGVGYHMTMVKGSKCDSGLVTGLVKDTVSGAEQVTDVGAELSFLLPSQSAQQFPDLFDILDSKCMMHRFLLHFTVSSSSLLPPPLSLLSFSPQAVKMNWVSTALAFP